MHLIIAGGGRTGRKLVELFKGHPRYKATLIEKDPKKCELISEIFPYIEIVLGNATHPKTIKEAMTKNTEAFIAVTSKDYMNILASKAAKKMGIPQVILRVADNEYRELGKVMEMEDILDPADSVSAQVITHLNGVDIAQLIHNLHLDLELKKTEIVEGSELVGLPPADFSKHMCKLSYPVFIIRNGNYYLPIQINKLKSEDTIIYWCQEKKQNKNLIDNLFKKRS